MGRKGVFCLEGLWDNDLRNKSTVEPILSLLNNSEGIPYIYRNCATTEEFEFFLSKWTQKKYHGYPILYLAFHGETGKILITRDKYGLNNIGDFLANKCKGSIIILGSCSTLDIDKRHLKSFINKTKALAICGYMTDVDWIDATAFELLLIHTIQDNKYDGRGISPIETKLNYLSKSFKTLKFRMVSVKS